ncbi:MAG: PAS domain-containing protein [Desulfobacteraceae bacterium]|nr:PAS domain-containing protein [Desulfobacteraceae bacterium]
MKMVNKKLPPLISPFMMAGVLLVLLPIFAFMTLDRMEKQKNYTMEQLLIRGTSLIRTFEAGTRTGMLTMRWGAPRIQAMLLETSIQPNVDYIMITSSSGEILADSDPSMVGKRFDAMPDITAVQEDTLLVSHRVRQIDGDPVFEVFKRFTPLASGFRGRHKPFHGGDKRHKKEKSKSYEDSQTGAGGAGTFQEFWPESWKDKSDLESSFSGMDEHYIFVGLSMTQASAIQHQLEKQTIGRGVLFFLIGCIGVICLFAFQAYRSAKASLSSVKAFSDNVVQNMPAGLVTIDQAYRITSMNRAAKTILGQVPAKPFPQMLQLVGEMESLGGTVSREVTLQKETPQELRLDMTASPILDNEEGVLGFLFLFRDLTQLKELKKEVETTRHLAAIGKLAGGVAHEIRNPLSSIKGFATYFGKRYENNSEDRETAQIMVHEVERINRSITQLLEFAKPMAVEYRLVKIESLISHSLKLVTHDLDKKSIETIVNIRTDKTTFMTDPDRINQILLNLYMNAINAMDDGGKLVVDLLNSPDHGGIEIHVTDNGCGIDKKYLDDVFDPYFTTRPEGTGLGLSIVHRIVENLKGEIRVESSKKNGTRFMIRLPSLVKASGK